MLTGAIQRKRNSLRDPRAGSRWPHGFVTLAKPTRFDERDLENVWPGDDAASRHHTFVEPDAFESVIADGTRRDDYRNVYSNMAMDADDDGHHRAITRMDQQHQ